MTHAPAPPGLQITACPGGLALTAGCLRDLLDLADLPKVLAAVRPALVLVCIGGTRMDLRRDEHLALWHVLAGALLRRHVLRAGPRREAVLLLLGEPLS